MAISSGRYVSVKSSVVTSIRSSIRGGGSIPIVGDWILLLGAWADNGVWKDDATWNDGV